MGSGFRKLQSTLCLLRGIAGHQSALVEKLHRKHTGIQRTTWWGAGEEFEMLKNATYALGEGVKSQVDLSRKTNVFGN